MMDIVSIESIAFIADGNYSSKYPRNDEFITKGVPFIRANNFENSTISDKDMLFISEEKHSTITKGHLKHNDVLITTRGNIGKTAIVPKRHENSNINAQIVLLRCKDNCYPKYLMHCFSISFVKNQLDNNTTGTALKQLSVGNLRKIQIPLPPLETQKAIAEKLDKADALRKKDQELFKQYDELAQSIFIDMFGDPVQNEKGWDINELNNVSTKITDGTHDTPERLSEGVKFITGKHIRPFFIDYKNSDYVTEDIHKEIYKRCNPEYEDILYTNIGVNYATAAMNVVNYEFSMKNVALIKYNRNVFNGRYLEYLLNDGNFKDRLKNKFGVGGAQQFLSLKQIKSIEVYLPPLDIQNQFAEKIKNIEAQKELVKKQAEESENLFQALLQESFNFG